MAGSPTRIEKVVGQRVAAHRGKKGWSRPELADKLDINRTHLWRIECGRASPSLGLLDRMARLFGVSLDKLGR